MRVGLLFCLGVCGWFMSVAEAAVSPTNSHPVSLQECIDLALSQNLDLQVQHLSTDIVRDQLTASYGPYVPSFSFFARHDTLSQPADFDPKKSGIDFPYQLNTDLAGTALNGVLPFGFSYNLNGQAGRKDARTDFNA